MVKLSPGGVLLFPLMWAVLGMQAQSTFDVVAIKPSKTAEGGMGLGRSSPNSISLRNTTARSLMARAYGIKEDLVFGGPGWVASSEFDLEAKVLVPEGSQPPPLNRKQIESMMRGVLADRFKLVVHPETKELPVYELTVAKGGFKSQTAKSGDTYSDGIRGPDGRTGAGLRIITPDGRFIGQGIGLSELVDTLAMELHRTVIDRTGLAGKYDITMQFPRPEAESASDASGRSIFTILQEDLGLRLTASKGPVSTLVIDHIERPSDN